MADSLFNNDDPVAQEVEQRLRELQQDPEEMLRRFDRNGDGVLDAEERRAIRDVLRREVEQQSDSDDDELIGDRYRVVAPIGRGAQGHTRLAVDIETDDFVALKEVDFAGITGWDAVDTFEREAAVLGGLEHPGIPRMRETFRIEEDGVLRLIMAQDFVEGDNLDVKLRDGALFDETSLHRYAEELLDILTYLHQHSPPVIHRDIKPANVIERPDGSIALVDFGAAQGNQLGVAVIGTTGYMSPEQLMGRAVPASDLYGLAATLIHLATRKHPADMGVGLELDWRKHATVSEPFARWLDRCTAPMPEDRFPSAIAARADARRSFLRRQTDVLPDTEELVDQATLANRPNVSRDLVANQPAGCTLTVRQSGATLAVDSRPDFENPMNSWLGALVATVAGAFVIGTSGMGWVVIAVFLAVALSFVAYLFRMKKISYFECSPKGITLHQRRGLAVKRHPIRQISGTSTRFRNQATELVLHLRDARDVVIARSVRRDDVLWLQNIVRRYLIEQRMNGADHAP